MKKICVVLVLIIILVFILTSGKDKEVPIQDNSTLIGIWTLVNQYTTDYGDTITQASIQFKSDGTCYYAYELRMESGGTMTGKAEGTCYLNEKKSKFKMAGEKAMFKKWVSFEEKEDVIKIDKHEYKKVK